MFPLRLFLKDATAHEPCVFAGGTRKAAIRQRLVSGQSFSTSSPSSRLTSSSFLFFSLAHELFKIGQIHGHSKIAYTLLSMVRLVPPALLETGSPTLTGCSTPPIESARFDFGHHAKLSQVRGDLQGRGFRVLRRAREIRGKEGGVARVVYRLDEPCV